MVMRSIVLFFFFDLFTNHLPTYKYYSKRRRLVTMTWQNFVKDILCLITILIIQRFKKISFFLYVQDILILSIASLSTAFVNYVNKQI